LNAKVRVYGGNMTKEPVVRELVRGDVVGLFSKMQRIKNEGAESPNTRGPGRTAGQKIYGKQTRLRNQRRGVLSCGLPWGREILVGRLSGRRSG